MNENVFISRYRDDLPCPCWEVGRWGDGPFPWEIFGSGETREEAWRDARRLLPKQFINGDTEGEVAMEEQQQTEETPKKRRGRKPGSTNSPTPKRGGAVKQEIKVWDLILPGGRQAHLGVPSDATSKDMDAIAKQFEAIKSLIEAQAEIV